MSIFTAIFKKYLQFRYGLKVGRRFIMLSAGYSNSGKGTQIVIGEISSVVVDEYGIHYSIDQPRS